MLRSIVGASDRRLLPHQIALELHYQTRFAVLPFYGRFLTAGEIGLFMDYLWRVAGYALVGRHHNRDCKHCAEVLLARFHRPREVRVLQGGAGVPGARPRQGGAPSGDQHCTDIEQGG